MEYTKAPAVSVSEFKFHLAVLVRYVSPSVLPEHAELTQDEAGDHSGLTEHETFSLTYTVS